MNKAVHIIQNQKRRRPTAEDDRRTQTSEAVPDTNNSGGAIAQRKLADSIHNSPVMAAQRQQFKSLFGPAAQLFAGHSAPSPVVQRVMTGGDKVSATTVFGKSGAKLLEMPAGERWAAVEDWINKKGNKKNPPTVQEVIAHLGVAATDVVQPAPTVAVVEGLAFSLTLIDEDGIGIGLDDHQNKHQTKSISGLKQYGGGKAGKGEASGKFPGTANAAWHTGHTAETMRTWVTGLDTNGDLDPAGTLVHSATGEDLGDGIGYVATAMKDSNGKLYGSYHCYPLS